MTDSEKYKEIDDTKHNIEQMGFTYSASSGDYIKVQSVNFEAYWNKNGLKVTPIGTIPEIMTAEQWENYSTDVDNFGRAIFWVNQIKDFILN